MAAQELAGMRAGRVPAGASLKGKPMTDRIPWAHVAVRDGKFLGVISHDSGTASPVNAAEWKMEVAKFCGGCIADGDTITTVYDRAEYLAMIEGMPVWEHPDRKE